MKNILYNNLFNPVRVLLCVGLIFSFVACNSADDIQDDPYGGGKEPYGIKLLTDLPTPDKAYPGDEVTYKAKGLSKWFDEIDGKPIFDFFISNEKAEIIAATDTTIRVKVPESLSSGIAHILVKEQLFYGPKLTVLGSVSVDKGYVIEKPITGAIYNSLEHYEKKDHYHWVGNFFPLRNDDNKITGIAWVDNKGKVTDGWNGSYYKIDRNQGIKNDINNPNSDGKSLSYAKSISYFKNDKVGGRPTVLISGDFTKYHPVEREQSISVNHMMKVEHNMGILFDEKELPSIKGGKMQKTRITKFNGGTKEPPVATYITSDDKVIAVGNITQYSKVNLESSYAEDLDYKSIAVNSVLRMNNIGELDEDYRKNKAGAIGLVQDAYMDEEDGIVIVGNINSFDGVLVNNIVRLGKDGNLDEQFLQNIGTGANGAISKIRYNKKRKKAMVVGVFTAFNGIPCSGVVMLNSDGTIAPDFKLCKMEGGMPNFATLLNDHDIVVMSGTFKKYDGISRHGFLMLTMEGEAIQKFNVPGMFLGELNQVIECKTSTNDNGLLLLGRIYRFNGEIVDNAVKIQVDFE